MKHQFHLKLEDVDKCLELPSTQMIRYRDYSLTGDYVVLYLYKIAAQIKNNDQK